MWSVDIGNSDAYPDAPEGTARLWDGETYVGTVDAAYAFVIVAKMNEAKRRQHSVKYYYHLADGMELVHAECYCEQWAGVVRENLDQARLDHNTHVAGVL